MRGLNMIKIESVEIVGAQTWENVAEFNCWGNIATFPNWNITSFPISPTSKEIIIKVKVSEATWDSLKSDFITWQDIKDNFIDWNDIKNYISK
jgi:hypothetical protein